MNPELRQVFKNLPRTSDYVFPGNEDLELDEEKDRETLEIIGEDSDTVKNLEVAEVIIKTKKPIAIKNFNDVEELGRFVLVHDENILRK